MAHPDSEAALEAEIIEVFASLGWQTVNLYNDTPGPSNRYGRRRKEDVLLTTYLHQALTRLNPLLPAGAIDKALEEFTRIGSNQNAVLANKTIYTILKDGLPTTYKNDHNQDVTERVKFIDWRNRANNDFLLVSQMWVSGTIYNRRPDLIGFVNGIPLLFIELKKDTVNIKHAYDDNLSDYRAAIPQLFWYNAFLILSNGSDSRLGTITSQWEHFTHWKRINDEGETGRIALETMVHATCTPARLLDLVENFTVYRGETAKIVAQNHQYLGVNKAYSAVQNIQENKGRLGVFWHTQGSGKSYSMVFLAQKILRQRPGNWTFVIITDRQDLDTQIYKTFSATGAVTGSEELVRAQSGDHLRQQLQKDQRYLFTLIQKFQAPDEKPYPVLSTRSDIIVITDEAHRSQYATLADNMRRALPNAAFIGFTGTPLIKGEEQRTKELYGDYVSIYNFRQSIEDGATVPLYYENRIPEIELVSSSFQQEMEKLLEEAELDEAAEEKFRKQFAQEYHLITSDKRLERIAEDIVAHFLGRGFLGKGMVVSIDKLTAVRLYHKVQTKWQAKIAEDKHTLSVIRDPLRTPEIRDRLAFMESTDMAVVISASQNEESFFQKHGLDIKPHRHRLVHEHVDEQFKDPQHPLRLVFVCAMWMTGFDVPSCSTIYLDKPMRNHTLMQTIARANRVYEGKNNGLIVDYIGIFRHLEEALAIYANPTDGGGSDIPIKKKEQLVEQLRAAVDGALAYCDTLGVDMLALARASAALDRVQLRNDAVEMIVLNQATQQGYFDQANYVERLYKAILPDPAAAEFGPLCLAFKTVSQAVRALTDPPDLTELMQGLDLLVNRSIEVAPPPPAVAFDLSKLDLEVIKVEFAIHRNRTVATLRSSLQHQVAQMVALNASRVDYEEQLAEMIEEYNAGRLNLDQFLHQLLLFSQALQKEHGRAAAEGLSEEELAIFDILLKPRLELTKAEIEQVRQGAKEMLAVLKKEKLKLDWQKSEMRRSMVRLYVRQQLEKVLPPAYKPHVQDKEEQIYLHLARAYESAGGSVRGI